MAEPAEQAAPTEPGATGYPARWEADVVLRDGGTAHLRPITPEDAAALQEFHTGQSAESIYLRFFGAMPRLSESDLARFTTVDHHDRVALIATIGERIVAVGRYDRTGPATAEVAFHVSDAHQGRGLGSVLLEHLAAAARENGIHRFEAEVLPQNRKMISVFREAGYVVADRMADGVLSLAFDIDPTEASLAVMEAREHRAEARSVESLLNPRSVLLVGPFTEPGTAGHRLAAALSGAGFTGRFTMTQALTDEVVGNVGRDGAADLVVIALPAAEVLPAVRQAARAGARGVLVVSGGFAEAGPEGAVRQRELLALARAHGLRLIGPNSWGLLNADPAVRLNASLVGGLPAAGSLGVFCQSGAASLAVATAAARAGVGLSAMVSAGNRADVSGNDCMQYWEADPRTEVIALYLESIGNPRKFSRIARRLSRRKPVIVLKSGASGYGVPPGHEVRPSRAPQQAFGELLRQSGCLRVDGVDHLLDVARLLLAQPLPTGPRVAVVSNSDALARLLADAASGSGLEVVHGPITLDPLVGPAECGQAVAAASAAAGVQSVLVGLLPTVAADALGLADGLDGAAAAIQVPVAACLIGEPDAASSAGSASSAGGGGPAVPRFTTPEAAVRALATVTAYGRWRRRSLGVPVDPVGCQPALARGLVRHWLAGGPPERRLDPDEAGELLACYGIRLWPALPVHGPDDAIAHAETLGWPVVLKTTAAHLRHRVDLGGVQLDIRQPTALREHVAQMQRALAPLGAADLVVQRMAPPGVACVIRSVEDPLFGPVVSFGLSGDASELLGDWSHRIPPLTDLDAADLVRSIRAAPKLFGHHGSPACDTAALEQLIARASRMADDLPEVADLELSPVVVGQRGAAVLGAQVRLAPPPGRSDTGRRGLTAPPEIGVTGWTSA